MTNRRLTHALVSLAACMLLTSCVLPIPGSVFVNAMRDNVGERVADFIVAGVTTREDVLMHLGEADNSSFDESELSYRSGIHRGGVAVLLPIIPAPPGFLTAYERYREVQRTLTVEFDEAGLVKSARLETETCSEDWYLFYGEKQACVTVAEHTVPGDAPKHPASEAEP